MEHLPEDMANVLEEKSITRGVTEFLRNIRMSELNEFKRMYRIMQVERECTTFSK